MISQTHWCCFALFLSFLSCPALASDTPRVTFKVEGAGLLAAVGSGDMASLDSYQGPGRTLFQGRAVAVVRSSAQAGTITLTATSPGLESARLTLESFKP
jgi:beta-galactosidase